ncbi:MAG: aldo/keto reductase [Verrucomicrobia bacterium]|nr:aldo/keto reductase [Verrucomicrobiota bacterium]
MQYRQLGNTGLKVSILGFGGSSLGSVFRDIDEAAGVRCVHTAIEHGINLIDTAPYYGRTRAETVLGKALREIPRDNYLLATKVARYGPDLRDCDYSAERVIRSVDESLARLGVAHVDFIQVHDMEFGDINQIITETIPALRRVQAAGKARWVGITGLPLHLFQVVMERVEVDQIQSYCHYCLNDTALAGVLPYLLEKGVGIFNSAPLAMRLLSVDGPLAWHPAPAALRAKCAAAAQLCASRGSDLSRLALQFAVSCESIPTTIVGTASPARIVQNIREIAEPIDHELLSEVLALLQPVHNTTWPQGRPENNSDSRSQPCARINPETPSPAGSQ